MRSFILIFSLFLLLASCGDDGQAGLDGNQGASGVPGSSGQTPVIKLIRVEGNLVQCPSKSGVIIISVLRGMFGDVTQSSSYICDGADEDKDKHENNGHHNE